MRQPAESCRSDCPQPTAPQVAQTPAVVVTIGRTALGHCDATASPLFPTSFPSQGTPHSPLRGGGDGAAGGGHEGWGDAGSDRGSTAGGFSRAFSGSVGSGDLIDFAALRAASASAASDGGVGGGHSSPSLSSFASSALPAHLRGGGVMPFSGTPSTPLTADDRVLLKETLIAFIDKSIRAHIQSGSEGEADEGTKKEEGLENAAGSDGNGSGRVVGSDDENDGAGVSASDYRALLDAINDEEERREEEGANGVEGGASVDKDSRQKQSERAAAGVGLTAAATASEADIAKQALLTAYRAVLESADDRTGKGISISHLPPSSLPLPSSPSPSSSACFPHCSSSSPSPSSSSAPHFLPAGLGAAVLKSYYPHAWNILDDEAKALLRRRADFFGPTDVRISQTKETGRYVTYCLALLRGSGGGGGGNGNEGPSSSSSVATGASAGTTVGSRRRQTYESIRIHAIGDGISTAVRVANIIKEKFESDSKKRAAAAAAAICKAATAVPSPSPSSDIVIAQETSIDTVWCSSVYVLRPSASGASLVSEAVAAAAAAEGAAKGGAASAAAAEETLRRFAEGLLAFLPERAVARHKTPIITITLTKQQRGMGGGDKDTNPLRRSAGPASSQPGAPLTAASKSAAGGGGGGGGKRQWRPRAPAKAPPTTPSGGGGFFDRVAEE